MTLSRLCLLLAISACTGLSPAQSPIVQPGAPGKPAKLLSADEAIEIADSSFSPDDLAFMQDMIPHHHQAMVMSSLVADRTNRPELVDVAGRIDASQADEIEFMQGWLRDRGQRVPDPAAHDAMNTPHEMAGMASPEEMEELASLDGTAFDRLFLKLMITHHEGAVTMVEELHERPGSAYDPVLFEFTNDIVNDQRAEIERMNALLVSLSDDPRANLSAGLFDAGQALLNLELVASLPKPAGFFDPDNPGGIPPKPPQDDEADDDDHGHGGEAEATEQAQLDPEGDEEEDGRVDQDSRWPLRSFAFTDMAFAGDVLVAGSYHGFNIYKLDDEGAPDLLSSVVCPGGQGDVSVVGDLLIMSVEETRGRLDCGLDGVSEDVSPERFRGLRILDISDLTRPVQVGAVQTCRGSHTHSVVQADEETILVYNSGTSSIREEEELEGCIDATPGDDRTALFRIDVIEIPVKEPSKARIIGSPAVFADPEQGRLAGLWKGGDHGDDTQETNRTDHCHDITVFPEKKIAAGACSGNGILFDISDPLNPKRIDAVVDKGFAYWHSATFNNDGSKVIFTDEWGGGTRPRCRSYDPLDWGADAIYDIVDGKLEFRSYYKMSAPQLDQENCVAHNGSVVPVPGRDIFVQAWYQGGISIVDFTDSANPVEIAYFDRGPIDDEMLTLAGYWSTYFYEGRIYGTEIARGLDVLKLVPSEYLSENEIAAAGLAQLGGIFNPQQQWQVRWPVGPVLARAYLDQLSRAGELRDATVTAIAAALERVEAGERDEELATDLESAAATFSRQAAVEKTEAGAAIARHRLIALAETLEEIAGGLR
jgi:uncharacterized protein (DUF305 family)